MAFWVQILIFFTQRVCFPLYELYEHMLISPRFIEYIYFTNICTKTNRWKYKSLKNNSLETYMKWDCKGRDHILFFSFVEFPEGTWTWEHVPFWALWHYLWAWLHCLEEMWAGGCRVITWEPHEPQPSLGHWPAEMATCLGMSFPGEEGSKALIGGAYRSLFGFALPVINGQ